MISDNLKKRFYTYLALILVVFLMFNYNFFLVYFLITLSVLSILEFLHISKKVLKSISSIYLINFFFISYVFSFCFLFLFFSNFIGLKIILFILLLGCVASDTGGYVFGKIFKGPKLTKISPKKTYAGAIGSFILTTLILSIFFYYFIQTFNIKIIIVALMTSLFCQIGDLIFSFLKRKAKFKDTGKILPGHGGILDRIDGLLLGIPFGFLTFVIVN